jgi:colanic acid/amylovoran biosynthesis glycosyltransferase
MSYHIKMPNQLNVCIAHPNNNVYSETFIKNHIKYLPNNIFSIYGSMLPEYDSNDVHLSVFFFKANKFRNLLRIATKLLPAFLFNRLPSIITGLPKNDVNLHYEALKFYLLANKIDVVLAEFMLKGIALIDICRELNIPLIIHTHGGGDLLANNASEIYKDEYLYLSNKISRIIAVDSFSLNILLNLGVPKCKINLIRYGVDLELFAQIIPSNNNIIFFSVGRFTGKKAPYMTILSFNEVVKKFPKAKLIFAGHGELLDTCIQLVKSFRLERNVEFPGILSNEDVSKYMGISRAYVQHSLHTSYSDSEGTPVAILEAMARGLPIISTIHNGINDVVNNNVSGLLCKELDFKTMSENMIRMIEDPEFANILGNAARKYAEQNFKMEYVIGELNDVILDVVKHKE